MNQRLIAAVVAAPLVLVLVVAAAVMKLPFVTYAPGSTFDVLGKNDGVEIIQVDGHAVYRDDGQLRMTTVLVSVPQQRKNLFEVLAAWASPDDAVYPYDAIYDQQQTPQESDIEGQVEMTSSQDTASAVALEEMGVDVPAQLQVAYVDEGTPADGKLEARDVIERADGTKIVTGQDLVKAIQGAPKGEPVRFTVLRGGDRREVAVTPEVVDGEQRVGIRLGIGFDLPFPIDVNIDPAIGGPSAGLMFSLAIYDTLTKGSLTDGESIAGTGTIDPTGAVGPIGGIAQKIAGARAAGAQLFMVPPDNCADALSADAGDMRLVRAETMHDARTAIEDWTVDHDADLPSCEAA